MSDETPTQGQAVAPSNEDTAPAPASEADVQTNTDAPDATQTAEENAGEVKAEETAEEKLYAGKYKSPEDMEKAYKELESKFGQTTSEKAELTRILNDAFAAPEPTPAQVADDYTEPDPTATEIANLKRGMAVQGFVISHPDADVATIQKVIAEDPYVKSIGSPEAALEYAYLRSQNMAQSKAIAEATKKGAQAAENKVAEKQVAQVESARKAVPTDENSEMYAKATGNFSREQRDKARLEVIKRNLVDL